MYPERPRFRTESASDPTSTQRGRTARGTAAAGEGIEESKLGEESRGQGRRQQAAAIEWVGGYSRCITGRTCACSGRGRRGGRRGSAARGCWTSSRTSARPPRSRTPPPPPPASPPAPRPPRTPPSPGLERLGLGFSPTILPALGSSWSLARSHKCRAAGTAVNTALAAPAPQAAAPLPAPGGQGGGGGEAGVARERVRDYPVDSLTGEWPAMTRSDGTYCVLAGSDGSKVSG